MDTDESIPAGVKAVCDALCTVLGVKVPLRLIPHPQSTKPHIVIKRDTPKADDASDIDPKCARFTFVANKRINVNKGAVLLFGIEQPTPEAAPKSTAPSVDSFLLEADLIGASDEEEDAPKPGKQAKSEVKRARSEARKNMVALPPKMRKALGQKLPNMYYAAAHELGPTPAIPCPMPGDAHTPRVFCTAAVQTDDLAIPPPSPSLIPIALRAPSCSADDLRKSPVQLPSPVSADHAREMTPNTSLAPLEDEVFRYEHDRSLSPMDLESGDSSPEGSPAGGHVALPDENVAPAPQVLPEVGLVSPAIVDDALPSSAEGLNPPPPVAVPSDSTSANDLETPPEPLAETYARAAPPHPDSPELIVTELPQPMEGVIESLPEVEVKREQIQAAESLVLLVDALDPSDISPATSEAIPTRSAKEIPSEPRAMRNATMPWGASKAPPTFVKATQASSGGTWDQPAAPYSPVAPTLTNPLGIRPSANAQAFHRAPPTGPRSLLSASSSSAPKKPVMVGAKWSASRGPTQSGALNATTSSSSLASSTSTSASSSATTMTSLGSPRPMSPSIPSSGTPPTAPKADRDLSTIVGYTSPSPPPSLVIKVASSAPPAPPAPEIKAAAPSQQTASVETLATSKWKRIDGATSSSTPTLSPVLPTTSAIASPLLSAQPVSIPVPSTSSPIVQPTNALASRLPIQPLTIPIQVTTSNSTSLPSTSSPCSASLPSATTLPTSTVSPTVPAVVRPGIIPLPSKPITASAISLPYRPASVLAVPASLRATPTVRPTPPTASSSSHGARAPRHTAFLDISPLQSNSASVPSISHNPTNTTNSSNLSTPAATASRHTAFLDISPLQSNGASVPSISHNPPNTTNSSNPSTPAATASPPNPRKRPHESSVKTVEVKMSSSPAVSSVPLGAVKMETSPPPEHTSSSMPPSASAAGSSRMSTPASFLKAHVPQPASSQMAVDANVDLTEGTDTNDTSATGATAKKKRRRQKKPHQRWKGDAAQDAQALVAGGPQAGVPAQVVAAAAAMAWPTTVPKLKHRLVPNVSPPPGANAVPGVKKIMVSGDGARIAILCEDHTLRIWLNECAGIAPGEIARLNHKQSLVTACWMDMRRILVLTRDGAVLLWTRSVNGKEEWNPLRLFTLPEMGPDDATYCLAYAPDRIAVSVPSGVKIWLYLDDKWQQQRDIIRGGVTAIKFVHDGAGLIGGCRDGVIWYCEVPNGTLRAYAFLSQQRKAIESIDIHYSGLRMLVTQEGGRAYLISLNASENRGTIEQTYTSETFHNSPTPMFPGVFAMRGQTVLYGCMQDCVPIWNRKKGSIVYGLKHNKGDVVQAAATFDDPSGVGGSMITGTSKGELFWWPPPEVHQSTSHVDTPDDASRKRQRVG